MLLRLSIDSVFADQMASTVHRPILVTGAHRSGSTWTGRIIASSRNVRYIHELFNPDAHKPGICAAAFEREFTYLCDENSGEYVQAIDACLRFRYQTADGIRSISSLKTGARFFRDRARFALSRMTGMRPLLKDPHAIFSAEWLARTFNMDVVILVRHPAAFAGSLKKANWFFDFTQFLDQPLLMRDHLRPFEKEIREQATERGDIIGQAILLWNAIHATILKYRQRHPEWQFVLHEDLSMNPATTFQRLFDKLQLEYTDRINHRILDFSGSHNPVEQHAGNELKRNSRANVRNWRKRLTPEETQRIRKSTCDVAEQFFGDEYW